MAGILSRPSKPAPLSPYNIDDPFESTAVPGARGRSGGSSALFLTASKGVEAGSDKDLQTSSLSRACALESWRSTPSPLQKARTPWNGEYLYLSTPRRGPRLESVSPIPLEYDQPIAETTPSASSDEFDPDVASPLFQKSVEALRREGWGDTFQQSRKSDDISSSEAETEIQEADLETGPGLGVLPETSFSTQSEASLAFLEEPSTAREFDAGLLLGKINFNSRSASARSFNSRCLVSRIKYVNDGRNDRAHGTATGPHTVVQTRKATGLVRKVDIHSSPSNPSSGFNQRRLKRKPKFEVQKDAGNATVKRNAPEERSGGPQVALKDKTNLPLRMRKPAQQPSPNSLKYKPKTAAHKLQQTQHSLPDALKAGFIRKSEPTECPSVPATAVRKPVPSDFKTAAILGSSRIPHPSPLPARSITPSKRIHKPTRRLPEYRCGRFISPDHANEATARVPLRAFYIARSCQRNLTDARCPGTEASTPCNDCIATIGPPCKARGRGLYREGAIGLGRAGAATTNADKRRNGDE